MEIDFKDLIHFSDRIIFFLASQLPHLLKNSRFKLLSSRELIHAVLQSMDSRPIAVGKSNDIRELLKANILRKIIQLYTRVNIKCLRRQNDKFSPTK